MIKRFLCLVAGCVSLLAFEQQPYFGETWEFYLTPFYGYRYYPAVQNAKNPSQYSSHDHALGFNLEFSFLPCWDLQIESEFASSHKLSWTTRSVGVDLRYMLLDDVQGDPVSLTLGSIVRYVPIKAQTDPSTPYHSTWNFELGTCVGKEIDYLCYWIYRFWGYFGAGIANRGAPWINTEIALEANRENRYYLRGFLLGYMGFGGVHTVNIDELKGYANIYHRSIDIGGRFTYLFDIWGKGSIEYAYRVFAKAFPKQAHTVVLRYTLPFSIL